ncbi:MAG: YigZ family protein [Paracoccaceae bacterium]|jgi:putative IMPACT (imprinted ancient) family translation regulator
MLVVEDILRDRGSRYAVSGGPVADRAAAGAFLAALKTRKRFAKATHNSWAVLFSNPEDAAQPEPVKADDGEAGAGAIILQELQAAGLHDHIVVVSRWFGGVHLGGDRFRHVRTAVRLYLARRDGLS